MCGAVPSVVRCAQPCAVQCTYQRLENTGVLWDSAEEQRAKVRARTEVVAAKRVRVVNLQLTSAQRVSVAQLKRTKSTTFAPLAYRDVLHRVLVRSTIYNTITL